MDAEMRLDTTSSLSRALLGSRSAVDDLGVTKGPEKRDIRFSLRIPASLHARLRKAADADRRTMADFTLIALERAVEEFEAALAAKKTEKGEKAR